LDLLLPLPVAPRACWQGKKGYILFAARKVLLHALLRRVKVEAVYVLEAPNAL
jgi:hypothetical protein